MKKMKIRKAKTYVLMLGSIVMLAFSAMIVTKTLRNNTKLLNEIAEYQFTLSNYSNQLNQAIQDNQAKILEAPLEQDTDSIRNIHNNSTKILQILKQLSDFIDRNSQTLPQKVININKIISKRSIAYKSIENSILKAIEHKDREEYHEALIGFNSTAIAFTNDVLKLVEAIDTVLQTKINTLQNENKKANRLITVIFILIALLLFASIYLTLKYQKELLQQLTRAENAEKKATKLAKKLENYSKELKEEVERKTHEIKTNLYTSIITKLPNRNKLLEDIQNHDIGYLALLDIDNFQKLNDVYGEELGNEVLRLTGEFLKENTPSQLQLYHLSGDEFVIAADKIADISKKRFITIIESILRSYRKHPFILNQEEFFLSMSAGMSFIGLQKNLAYADMALKKAKNEGKNYEIFHSKDIEMRHKEDIECYNKLLSALDNDRIVAYLQPIVPINNKTLPIKYEALVRLIDENGTAIPPVTFLKIAKQKRIYHRITYKMIDQVFDLIENHRIPISINLSMIDITNEKTVKMIYTKLQHFKHCELVTFELLETEDFENYDAMFNFCIKVKQFGVSISLDDFGSGYSNFSHIIHLPIDFIKIDASLISNIAQDFASKLMVETIVDLAKKIDTKTVAEFVSSKEILTTIHDLGIDYAQGFFIGKPKEAQEYIKSPPQIPYEILTTTSSSS